jgi:hypothetical protein
MKVQEGHFEFSFIEKSRGLRTSCQCDGLHTGGIQSVANHLANRCLIVHDQCLSLHGVPPILSSTNLARSKKL